MKKRKVGDVEYGVVVILNRVMGGKGIDGRRLCSKHTTELCPSPQSQDVGEYKVPNLQVSWGSGPPLPLGELAVPLLAKAHTSAIK